MFHFRLNMLLETFLIKNETFVLSEIYSEDKILIKISAVFILPLAPKMAVRYSAVHTDFNIHPLKEYFVPSFKAKISIPVCELSG